MATINKFSCNCPFETTDPIKMVEHYKAGCVEEDAAPCDDAMLWVADAIQMEPTLEILSDYIRARKLGWQPSAEYGRGYVEALEFVLRINRGRANHGKVDIGR